MYVDRYPRLMYVCSSVSMVNICTLFDIHGLGISTVNVCT